MKFHYTFSNYKSLLAIFALALGFSPGNVLAGNENGNNYMCAGGQPAPSTLLKVTQLDFSSPCDEVTDQTGCGVSNLPKGSSKTCTKDGTTFQFSVDMHNRLSVTTDDGSKFSTLGFKGGGGKKCLAIYEEPLIVNGAAIIKNNQNGNIQNAFACKKDQDTLDTNLPYVNARMMDSEDGFCDPDEKFVGNPDTGRGVCLRCRASSQMGPPAPEDFIGTRTDVFQMAVFDFDSKTGDLHVAECGPPSEFGENFAATSAEFAPDNSFKQCNEDLENENGEPFCVFPSDEPATAGYEVILGGSGGCGTRSGRRVCVRR